jgi:hypothetical protein
LFLAHSHRPVGFHDEARLDSIAICHNVLTHYYINTLVEMMQLHPG